MKVSLGALQERKLKVRIQAHRKPICCGSVRGYTGGAEYPILWPTISTGVVMLLRISELLRKGCRMTRL